MFLGMVSCESLDESPEDFIEPQNFFSSVEDLDAGTVAAFRPLLRGGSWDGLSVRGWSLTAGAEDLTANRGLNKERILDFDDFIVNSENVDNKLTWKSLYASIASANLVIANKENVKINIEERDKVVGQAYFLRALSYFYLVRWWGAVPLVTEPSLQGVYDLERTPVDKVYGQIILDAQEAEKSLPDVDGWKDNAPGRPTVGAAKTLLAQVYITMAGWPLKQTDKYAAAAAKAKEVIDLGSYELEGSFSDLWAYDNRNGKEQIFNLQTARQFGTPYSTYTSLPYNSKEESGWSDYVSEIDFLNKFPDDERKPVTFKTVFVNPKTGEETKWEDSADGMPGINKYSDGGTGGARTHVGGALHPVYRYAEVLLLFAEATNEVSGPTAEAYGAVNKIRRRAKGLDVNVADPASDLPAGLSKEAFRDAVSQERAWEFAFEGKRWHELVRREKVKEANANHPFIDASKITTNNYLHPIPGAEREVNPNLTQNPGY